MLNCYKARYDAPSTIPRQRGNSFERRRGSVPFLLLRPSEHSCRKGRMKYRSRGADRHGRTIKRVRIANLKPAYFSSTQNEFWAQKLEWKRGVFGERLNFFARKMPRSILWPERNAFSTQIGDWMLRPFPRPFPSLLVCKGVDVVVVEHDWSQEP